jgi:hypothetical protein
MADLVKAIIGVEVKGQQSLTQLSTAVGKTEQSLKKLVPGADRANQSMVNLSRVVQDAPFGFIGIANNIDPLLQSFQALKASTGSTGGALKALGSSLLGGGGLALGVSLVTSALVVFGDKLFGTSKKAKESADELERVKKVIGEVSRSFSEVNISAGAGVEDEIAKVQILSKVVQDQTKSYKERNNALEQLKSINKNYFGDLTLESSSLASLTSRVNEYTNALIAAAVVKEFSSDIAKVTVETSKQLNAYNQLNAQLSKYNNELERTPKTERVLRGSAGGGSYVTETNKAYTELQGKIKETNKQLVEQGRVLSELSNVSRLSREGLQKAIEETLKFKPLTTGGAVTVKPDKVDVEIPKPIKLEKPIPIEATINFKDLKFVLLGGDLQSLKEQAENNITKSIQKLVVKPTINLAPGVLEGYQKLQERFKEIQRLAETVAGSVSNAFANAFSSIASGENVFRSLGNAIKAVVVDLIRAAIQGLIFNAVMNLILPGSGSASGSLGSLFGAIAGRRANGGPVGAGRTYLVGERGPELFTPGISGNIIPNGRMGSLAGSFGGGGTTTFVLRGSDLMASMAATGRAQTRLI